MERIRYIIIHSLLVIGLLLLPMQNVWAMANTAYCGMDMSACSADMDVSSATDLDCGDNHCNKCFHGSSVILTSNKAISGDNDHQRFVLLSRRYLSIITPLETPPPIIS